MTAPSSGSPPASGEHSERVEPSGADAAADRPEAGEEAPDYWTEARTWVDAHGGPVHTGDGPQLTANGGTINYFAPGVPGVRELLRGMARHGIVGVETVLTLEKRFVPPAGYHAAASLLANEHIVLLAGRAGAGRRGAALMLLTAPETTGATRRTPVRQLLVDEDADGAGLSEWSAVTTGPYLLDLSSLPGESMRVREARIVGLREVAASRGAYVVVILPELRSDVGDLLRELVVALGPPNAESVLRAHLREGGLSLSTADLDSPDMRRVMLGASVGEIATLAELTLAAAAHAGSAPPDPRRWLAEAGEALNPEKAAYRWVESIGDAERRALLLSVALLDGGRPEAVVRAARRLLGLCGHPANGVSDLERQGLGGRLEAIESAYENMAGVRFKKISLERHVLSYFVREIPELRETLIRWIVDVTRDRAIVTRGNFLTVAERIASVALRSDWSIAVSILVRRWTSSPNAHLAAAAAVALTVALNDEKESGVFRRQLLEWARTSDLSSVFAHVIIDVCVDVLAVSHPYQAVTRLHHLIAHDDPNVADRAMAALRELATDNQLRTHLAHRTAAPPRRLARSPRNEAMFLWAVSTEWLWDGWRPGAGDRPAVDLLVEGWKGVLGRGGAVACRERLTDWLSEAARREHDTLPLDILLRAAERRFDLLERLERHVDRWSLDVDGEVPGALRSRVRIYMFDGIDRRSALTGAIGAEAYFGSGEIL